MSFSPRVFDEPFTPVRATLPERSPARSPDPTPRPALSTPVRASPVLELILQHTPPQQSPPLDPPDVVRTAPVVRRRVSVKSPDTSQVAALCAAHVAFEKSSDMLAWTKCKGKKRRAMHKKLSMLKHRALERWRTGLALVLPGPLRVVIPPQPARAAGEPGFILRFWQAHAGDTDRCQLHRGASMWFFRKQWDPAVAGHAPDQVDPSAVIYGATAMLTYQGEWGVLNHSTLFGYERGLSADALVERVREHARAKELWTEFRIFIDRKVKECLRDVAVCAEICMGTYEATGTVRIHFHAWVDIGKGNSHPAVEFAFHGTTPHIGFVPLESSSRIKFAGAFYVSVEKIGSLWTFATVLPWKDYSVIDRWVTGLFAKGKLSASVTENLFLQVVTNAQNNVRNLKFVLEQRSFHDTQFAQAAARKRVKSTFSPWRHLPEVHKWQDHFSKDESRYMFLVLDGPSRMGKTRYAEGLVADGRAVVVDCAGAVTPDLSGFNRQKHDLVLFDELSVEAVIKNKKLFQSSLDSVCLGTSQTNVNILRLWMWRIRLVVASNCWKAEAAKVQNADGAWLKTNSVYVHVAEPLWVEVDDSVESQPVQAV